MNNARGLVSKVITYWGYFRILFSFQLDGWAQKATEVRVDCFFQIDIQRGGP